MGEIPKQEEIQENQNEHLVEGYRSIMASVGNAEQHDQNEFFDDIEAFGENVNYHGHPDLLNMHGFKADSADAGMPSYVISPVNEKDKFTKGLLDCTSVIAVGREISSDRDISLLTHQDPKIFLRDQKENFTNDLSERLQDLRNRCHNGSVDIVIAGGKLLMDHPEDYRESLEELGIIVERVFGFRPLTICGPKYPGSEADDAYLETQKRRLFIVRPKGSNFSNESFPSRKANEMQKKWEDEGIFTED